MTHPTLSNILENYTTPIDGNSGKFNCHSCKYCEKATLAPEEGVCEESLKFSHCGCFELQLQQVNAIHPDEKCSEELRRIFNRYAFPADEMYDVCQSRFFEPAGIESGKAIQHTRSLQKKWDCSYCNNSGIAAEIWVNGRLFILNNCDCHQAQYATIQATTSIRKDTPGPWNGMKYVYPVSIVRPYCKGQYFTPTIRLMSDYNG